ncbi:MAG: hypothetical protein A2046_04900 [Bacteroidetes bacterium GWA2_30_7]|nr:MAG: hypothetical protein A2046_04900 [Bacteroidetes bacterium GWA2_30_7]
MNINFDIVIIGAGPAGCSCALALNNSGLKVALIDKSYFPRDKICGDAIPGKALKYLKELSPEFYTTFLNYSDKLSIQKTAFFYNNKQLEYKWKLDAYNCKRVDFDNLYFNFIKYKTTTTIFEGVLINEIEKNKNGFKIFSKNNELVFNTKFIVGADGVNGITSKTISKNTLKNKHSGMAIRTYYKGIKNIENNRTEVYFNKKFMPGYFWIFPVSENLCNVGFGMKVTNIVKKKITLKNAFHEFINNSEILKEKFKNAEIIDNLKGGIIPFWSKNKIISGDNFISIGDAASLVDPISGDGIANAVLSGKLAANQIINCFVNNDFSSKFIKNYDKDLYKKTISEMKNNLFIQKIISSFPFTLDALFLIKGRKN